MAEEHTETGKQIIQGFEGVAAGLAAAFAPKKAPPKQERPVIKMKDPYSEAGTEGQFEDEVMERHRSGGMFSSEEVSSMTSDQFVEVMRSAGQMQTGLPESFALSGQGKHGRKLGNENWINDKYGSALENVGDGAP